MVMRVSEVRFCLFPFARSLRKQVHQLRVRMVELCAIPESRRMKGPGANSTKGPLRPFSFDRLRIKVVIFFFKESFWKKIEPGALNHIHTRSYTKKREEPSECHCGKILTVRSKNGL